LRRRSRARRQTRERYGLKIKADALFQAVCKALGMKRGEVTSAGKDREQVRARELVYYVGRSCTDLSVKAIAEMLGVVSRPTRFGTLDK
jgi:chromosomal replication initiation ATPase DnaA